MHHSVEPNEHTAAGHDAARRVVTFRVDQRAFGIDVGAVREIKGWQATTPLPHSAPYVRGVINLRGAIIAVYDLRRRIGEGETHASTTHVIIVVDAGEQVVGILVDAVSDIVDVPAHAVKPPPQVNSAEQELIEALAIIDGEVIGLLKLSALLAQPHRPLPQPAAA
jgi:purine-binding chemotaxis protein CheW